MFLLRCPVWLFFMMACDSAVPKPAATTQTEAAPIDSTSKSSPKTLSALMVFDQLVTDLNQAQAAVSGEDSIARDEALRAGVMEHLRLLNNEKFKGMIRASAASYATVLEQVRAESLPEVLAAVPMRKSMYNPTIQSETCAKGHWQLTPKTARSMGLKVSECRLSSGTIWSPKEDSVADSEVPAYLSTTDEGEGECLISGCAVDERMDLVLSTKAMLQKMKTIFNDSAIQKSGASVQAVVRVNSPLEKPPSQLPEQRPNTAEGSQPNDDAPQPLLGRMTKEGDYEASIIAIHLLARCVYGQEPGERVAEFKPFAEIFPQSYCTDLMRSK